MKEGIMRFQTALLTAASISAFCCVLLTEGCAPVFSDLQGAGLVGKDRYEITPSFSTVSWQADGESEHAYNHYGVQVGYGISDHADLRFRLEHIQLGDESDGVNVIGIGPKIGERNGSAALYLPVGTTLNCSFAEAVEFHPTLLTSLPLGRDVEFNPSFKVLIPLSQEGRDILMAVNLGMGFGPIDRFAIRPELGFLFNPGEEGVYRQFSLGFAVRTE
jgi:hypothetical protein